MTNKFRRSMTSVLLAASLLFSSQSVIAFADYGSKSDASDLSPVQESVENATEEQQEDPSLSVEPVIGESTETPVAAPMMARANAPVAYSAPSVDENRYESSQLDDDSIVNDAVIRIYQTKNISKYGEPITLDASSGDTFVQGLGYRIYTANTNIDGWVFKNWTTHIYRDPILGIGDAIDSSNLKGNMDAVWNSYAFSNEDDTTQAYISGKTVRINHLLTHSESFIYPLYYTLSANYNPLVTVDVGENGKVTYNGTIVDKDTTDKKIEVEYGTVPDFTITPDAGYKVASVTFGDTTIQANEDGTYTLPSVTEPTTLEVTFKEVTPSNPEKPTDNDIEKILNEKILVRCMPEDNHPQKKYGAIPDGYKLAPVENKENEYTLTILYNAYVNAYNTDFKAQYGSHSLIKDWATQQSNNMIRDDTQKEWIAKDFENGTFVPLICDETNVKQISDIEVVIGAELRKTHPELIDSIKRDRMYAKYNGGEIFLSTNGKGGFGDALITDIPESLTTIINTTELAKQYFTEFAFYSFSDKKETFGSSYISDILVEGTKMTITLDTTPNLDLSTIYVEFFCENNNPEHNIEAKPLSSDEFQNCYTITYNDDRTMAMVTLDTGKLTMPENHVCFGTYPREGSLYFEYKDGQWTNIDYHDNVFSVRILCVPSEEEIRAMGLELILDCITEQDHHENQTFNLKTDKKIPITISAVPSSVMPISDEVSYNVFVGVDTEYCLAQYNDTHGEHTYAANNPDAVFVLEYQEIIPNSDDNYYGPWKVMNSPLTLNVQHTNPTDPTDPTDPGTNPGGNGGDNDDDDDRYTGGNTVTRTINDDDVPLNDRPTNTTTIDDEDVPLANLPDDTVTIDDGEVPLKANPSTGDSLPFAAMAAAALSLGGVIVLNRKKK